MKKQNKKKSNVGKMIVVGAGVAALSAAAYLLYGPDGKKNKKIIRSWVLKMKGDIIEKFEEAKEVTEPLYHKIVDEISAKYMKTKGVSQEEVNKVVAELRKNWKAATKKSTKKTK